MDPLTFSQAVSKTPCERLSPHCCRGLTLASLPSPSPPNAVLSFLPAHSSIQRLFSLSTYVQPRTFICPLNQYTQCHVDVHKAPKFYNNL
ncbi:hypothetical protein E2C01_091834 [Portunus trituberculatus]|uniref:Uncharacterized protein n=1 Tax=Portunus trituberculatus TaxID=210409 RepID=A0A5B7JP15_PORTR|nr:hypothetical protein [Portunus trituberculatus]